MNASMLFRSRCAVRQIAGIPRDQIHFRAEVREQAHDAAGIFRRIVHAAEKNIFHRDVFARAQRISPAGIEQNCQRIFSIDGHQRVALLVIRRVQGNREARTDFFLPEPLDAGNDAAGRKGDVPGSEPDAFGIEQNPHGSHRRVIVEQRFALAHQDYVRLRRKIFPIFFERDQGLPDNFSRGEIPDQAQLRG